MIIAKYYTDEELLEIKNKALNRLKAKLSKSQLTDLANALEAEHHLTLRER